MISLILMILMKALPFSTDIEKSILAKILLTGNPFDVMQVVSKEDFYHENHRHIFDAINTIISEKGNIDPTTVLAKAGGKIHENEILEIYNTLYPSDLSYNLSILRDKSDKRRLIKEGSDFLVKLYQDEENANEILTQLDSKIIEIQSRNVDENEDPNIIATRASINATTPSTNNIKGLPVTGIPELDYLMNGANPGNLIIVGGRPSMGKSMMANTIAVNTAFKLNKRVYMHGLEMMNEENYLMHLSADQKISYEALQRGKVSTNDSRIDFFTDKYIKTGLIHNSDRTGINVLQLCAKIKQGHKQRPYDLIIVDHGGLLRKNVTKMGNNIEEISQITGELKRLAKELRIPVILLWQLSREAAKVGKVSRPNMSMLRDAGSLEQDADVIALIHRPYYYAKNEESIDISEVDPKKAEIIIEKNRTGGTGVIYCDFVPDYAMFMPRSTNSDMYQSPF